MRHGVVMVVPLNGWHHVEALLKCFVESGVAAEVTESTFAAISQSEQRVDLVVVLASRADLLINSLPQCQQLVEERLVTVVAVSPKLPPEVELPSGVSVVTWRPDWPATVDAVLDCYRRGGSCD